MMVGESSRELLQKKQWTFLLLSVVQANRIAIFDGW